MSWNPRATAVATAVLLAACTAAQGAQRAPGTDVLIDDTGVYPESITSMRDGTLINGSVKGVVYRASGNQTKATPWIRSTPDNGLLSVLGVVADEKANTLVALLGSHAGAGRTAGERQTVIADDLRSAHR